jgi:hypothetical protein
VIHAELRAPLSAHQERTPAMSLEKRNQKLAGKKALSSERILMTSWHQDIMND